MTAPGIKIEVDRIHTLNTDGPTKAFCDVLIGESFIVKGVRVVLGKNGLFIAMPSQQGRDGKYYDIFYPVTAEIRSEMQDVVLKAYEIARLERE